MQNNMGTTPRHDMNPHSNDTSETTFQVTGWLTIIFTALLRPSAFMTFLDQGWWAIRRAALAALCIYIVVWSLLWLIISQWTPLSTRGVLVSALTTPTFILIIVSFGVTTGAGSNIRIRTGAAFWLLRPHIAFAVPWSVVFTLVFTRSTSAESQVWWQALQLPNALMMGVIFGLTFSSMVTIILQRHAWWRAKTSWRWTIAFVALVAALEIWWQPALILVQDENILLLPALIGVTLGVVRVLSWLWEAGWSTVLVLARRAGVSLHTIRRLHPVSFDELSLLPLPGLALLLADAYRSNSAFGIAWLLEVEQHNGQRRAVGWAVRRIIKDTAHAHSLLFALSITSEGIALLRRLTQQPGCPSAIRAYVMLNNVAEPGAWPTTGTAVRTLLNERSEQRIAPDVLLLLEFGSDVLSTADWDTAARAAQQMISGESGESQLLTSCRHIILASLAHELHVASTHHIDIPPLLLTQIQQTGDWPSRLLSAIYEHLIFLRRSAEHQERQHLYDV